MEFIKNNKEEIFIVGSLAILLILMFWLLTTSQSNPEVIQEVIKFIVSIITRTIFILIKIIGIS